MKARSLSPPRGLLLSPVVGNELLGREKISVMYKDGDNGNALTDDDNDDDELEERYGSSLRCFLQLECQKYFLSSTTTNARFSAIYKLKLLINSACNVEFSSNSCGHGGLVGRLCLYLVLGAKPV